MTRFESVDEASVESIVRRPFYPIDTTNGQELPTHPSDCLFCDGRGFYTVGGGLLKLKCNRYFATKVNNATPASGEE